MKSVNVKELKDMIDNDVDFQLIDVREPFENDICSLGGLLIPMAEIPSRIGEIDKNKKVVVHCRSGARSASVIDYLERELKMEHLYNLEGGILAWAHDIDPEMETY